MPSFPYSDEEIRIIDHLHAKSARRVFVRGLKVDAHIGVYDHEYEKPQPLLIDVDMEVAEPLDPQSDQLSDVVCYNKFSVGIQSIIDEGHIQLIETLAERICALGLSHQLVFSIRVRIEKPKAIANADAAGIEIFRTKL